MRRVAVFALFCAAGLSACSYNMVLAERGGTRMGFGKATSNGHGSGTLEAVLDGKGFEGTWVSTNESGAIGSVAYQSNDHHGIANAKAADGSTVRCEFVFGGSAGYGSCQDNMGRLYDLQLTR